MMAQTSFRRGALIGCWSLLASVALASDNVQATVEASQDVAPAAFEVASIRALEKPRFQAALVRSLPGGRFEASNATVIDLIRFAFGLSRTEVVEGGPAWVRADRYDVSATSTLNSGEKPAVSSGPPDRIGPIQQMVQRLLADRFNLSVRLEARSRPGRVLVLARRDGRLGPHLKPSALDCAAEQAARTNQIRAGDNPNDPQDSLQECVVSTTNGKTKLAGHSMADLAAFLSAILAGEPVRDRTGLKGPFVIELTAAPNVPAKYAEEASRLGPSLDVALTEQLGLKLERQSIDVNVIVVDRVDRPSPN
jgi:uncharacterized protein (TIGR03435 family)